MQLKTLMRPEPDEVIINYLPERFLKCQACALDLFILTSLLYEPIGYLLH